MDIWNVCNLYNVPKLFTNSLNENSVFLSQVFWDHSFSYDTSDFQVLTDVKYSAFPPTGNKID